MTTSRVNDGENADDKIIQDACDFASKDDAVRLCKALGCRVLSASLPCSLQEPLLSSTEKARLLQHRLLHPPHDEAFSSTSSHRILRALLMLPPAYESPWSAALEYISYLHSLGLGSTRRSTLCRSALRSSISEIQSFLQQTVAIWWERERRWHADGNDHGICHGKKTTSNPKPLETPRGWILRLVQQLMKPLIQDFDITTNVRTGDTKRNATTEDNYWIVPLELVATIVSITHGFERSLNNEILDCVFGGQIRPDRMLPLLNLATDLRCFLRPEDWKHILWTLQQQDRQSRFVSFRAKEDLPGFVTAILSLSSTLLTGSNNQQIGGDREQRAYTLALFHDWKRVAFNVFYTASTDPSTFSTVMTVFQTGVAGFSSDVLREWLAPPPTSDSSLDTAQQMNDVPHWVKANMVLTLMRAAKNLQTTLVDRLLSRALAQSKCHLDVALEGWKVLVTYAGARAATTKKQAAKEKRSWIKSIDKIFDGSSYTGKGHFDCGSNRDVTDLLNGAGNLVYQSLFLIPSGGGGGGPKKVTTNYIERAHDWINAAYMRLKSAAESLSSHDAVVIAVAFVVVFCEVPTSRSFVVKGIVQALVGAADFIHCKTDIALLNCSIISVILKWKDEENSTEFAELKPIFDILAAGELRKGIFFSLVRALGRTAVPAQEALLFLTRKRLLSNPGSQFWDANANSDRIQCSLYALVIMTTTPKPTVCTSEAWGILSEIIVFNRPALPVQARAWLFQLIQELLETESLSHEAATHMFRACQLRLLQFLARDKPTISVRKAFRVWNISGAHALQSVPADDIPGLYRLISILFFRTASGPYLTDDKTTLSSGRILLFKSCHPKTPVDVADRAIADFRFDLKKDNHDLILCKLAIFLFVSAIELVVGPWASHLEAPPSQTNNDFGFDFVSLKNELISQELKAFASMGTCTENLRPQWLESSVLSTNDSGSSLNPPDEAVHELVLELCSTVLTFLKCHRWHSTVSSCRPPPLWSDHKEFLGSLCSLSKRSEKLSHSRDPNTFLPEIQEGCPEFHSSCACLTLCAAVINSSISDRRSPSTVGCALSVATNELKGLGNFLNGAVGDHNVDADLSPMVLGLWHFYSSAADEEATVRFISYLTEFCDVPNSPVAEHPLLQARSPESIDTEIRELRFSVLNVFRKSLQALLRQGTSSSRALALPVRSGDYGKNGGEINPMDFLMKCLQKLAVDLEAGLEGYSGGISVEMYGAYIESVDALSKLLVLQVQRGVGSREMRSAHLLCMEIGITMKNIVFSYPPEQHSLYTKVFAFAAQSLPVLARCTQRVAMESHTAPGSLHARSGQYPSFATDSFELCVATLKQWIGSECPIGMDWATVTVPPTDEDQCSPLDGDSPQKPAIKDVLSPSPRSGVDEEVRVPSFVTVPNMHTPREAENAKLLIPTKDLWNWTCIGALIAMESTWVDALDSLRQQVKHGATKLQLPLSACSLNYIRLRTLELASTKRALSLLLSSGRKKDTGSSKRNDPKPLVVVVPASAKMKLCSLLDRMTFVLNLSFDIVDSYARQGSTPSHSRFIEALCCILAFCSVEVDFVANFRDWYKSEKNALPPSNGSRSKGGGTLTLFLKILFRIEKLESTLVTLRKRLQPDNRKLRSARKDPYDTVGKIEDVFVEAGSYCGNFVSQKSFLGTVEKMLTSLVKSRVLFEESMAASSTSHLIARLNKRKRRNVRQSERTPLRSRNQTVDNWLRSDGNMSDEKGEEEDAFLDLEDFIADG